MSKPALDVVCGAGIGGVPRSLPSIDPFTEVRSRVPRTGVQPWNLMLLAAMSCDVSAEVLCTVSAGNVHLLEGCAGTSCLPPTGRHRGCALAGPGSPLISAWARLCFGGIFQCYRRVWRSAGVYSSAVVDGPVLASPAASSTLPSGSRKVWPPLFSPGVAAARDQVFVAGS
jgi:hypothetical protein